MRERERERERPPPSHAGPAEGPTLCGTEPPRWGHVWPSCLLWWAGGAVNQQLAPPESRHKRPLSPHRPAQNPPTTPPTPAKPFINQPVGSPSSPRHLAHGPGWRARHAGWVGGVCKLFHLPRILMTAVMHILTQAGARTHWYAITCLHKSTCSLTHTYTPTHNHMQKRTHACTHSCVHTQLFTHM